ncbi:MAG: OmpA family protein [Pseudomonadota bacterium]
MFGLFLIPVVIVAAALLLEPEPVKPDPVQEQIILLPGEDGSVGAVTVTSAAGTQTLDRAYEAVDVTASGQLAAAQESEASVAERFGEVLEATPPPEVTFSLYFESGSSDTLTPASQAKVAELRELLAERPAPEIAVVGHTDTVGDLEDNDRLSLERARAVAAQVQAAGVSAVSIQASGRGERELLVPTADRVDEPRNRRVEITIR